MSARNQRERHLEAVLHVDELEREIGILHVQYELAVGVAKEARTRALTARRYLSTITSETLSMEELQYAITILDGRAP